MKGRNRLFFNLLSFLLLVVLVVVGIKTRDADKQIKRWQAEIVRRAERGVHDPQLKETVDKMEENLRARIAETFDLERDPLDLTRVIKTKKFLKTMGMETAETENRIRLAATITGEKTASAIIKYRGKSQMVKVGDLIGNYRVTYIASNRVNLSRAGEELKLKTEKAPDTMAEEEKLFGPDGMNKPKVSVKRVAPTN